MNWNNLADGSKFFDVALRLIKKISDETVKRVQALLEERQSFPSVRIFF